MTVPMFDFDNSYAALPERLFVRLAPTPVTQPGLIRINAPLAETLGLDASALQGDDGVRVLAGNAVAEGSDPLAMAYAGHQFGSWNPQLGDGRALLLGEVIGTDGLRYDIQLKGSGPTPFSRMGDGRAWLGPVLREYLVSEAMHALGVPTTRALAAVTTGDSVFREEGALPGAVLTRVSRAHIRVGTFQYFAARKDADALRALTDHAIARLYPEASEAENPVLSLLDRVIHAQADLIARWMNLGFIHGVMNTDNMSIAGETIDYGPCAFMDTYHPAKTFSSIDHQGRYAFANQGPIAHWNLTRFAETLIPLLDDDPQQAVTEAEAALDNFADIHRKELQRRFMTKIGIENGSTDDWSLVEGLLAAITEGEADFTLVFRHLSNALESGNDDTVTGLFNQPDAIAVWLSSWRKRLQTENCSESVALMRGMNPVFIPRNHRVEEAIVAGYDGDFAPFHRLNEVLRSPFTEQPDFTEYEAAPLPSEVVRATFCGT